MSFWSGLSSFGEGFGKTFKSIEAGKALNDKFTADAVQEQKDLFKQKYADLEANRTPTKALSQEAIDKLAAGGAQEAAITKVGPKSTPEENAKALEHLRNAQSRPGMSDYEYNNQKAALQQQEREAIDTAVRKYKGEKGVADWHKSQGEAAEGDFKQSFFNTRLQGAQTLQRASEDNEFLFNNVKGLMPELRGATYDAKNNAYITPDGKSVPITPEMRQQAMQQLELQTLRQIANFGADQYNQNKKMAIEEQKLGEQKRVNDARINALIARAEHYRNGGGKTKAGAEDNSGGQVFKNMQGLTKEKKAYDEAGFKTQVRNGMLLVSQDGKDWQIVGGVKGAKIPGNPKKVAGGTPAIRSIGPSEEEAAETKALQDLAAWQAVQGRNAQQPGVEAAKELGNAQLQNKEDTINSAKRVLNPDDKTLSKVKINPDK